MENIGRKRKVRFNLPEMIPDRSKIGRHVVNVYRNGCLVNELQSPVAGSDGSFARKPIIMQLPTVSSFATKLAPRLRMTPREEPRNVPAISAVSSSRSRLDNLKKRHIVIITEQPRAAVKPELPRKASGGAATICNRFSRLMLVEDVIASKPPPVILPIEQPPALIVGETYPRHAITARRIAKSLFSADVNSRLVADLISRWHSMRYREKVQSRQQLVDKIHSQRAADGGARLDGRQHPLDSSGGKRNSSSNTVGDSVSISSRLRTDARRFGSFKMSLESDTNVTTLLRAAREADEELLKIVLRKILLEGISKESLNSADKSGRTAISYICSTNLTHFLDILLQIPGVDVNKPDNEGNTPLHFAAQAGQADAVNMLITRSRSLQIDAKNNLGFTPLMKAALQGRTRCAKLLLFAGASPLETDYGRGLRAEQWAAFCGRPSCSEMIEKCARARLLDKTQSCMVGTTDIPKVGVTRSKTTTIQTQLGESFRAKFRKFLPFGTSIKGKQNAKDSRGSSTNNNNNKDIVGYLKSATICASGPALSSEGKGQMLNKLTKNFDVPKLEVTPANNQQLIKKYEKKMCYEQADVPTVKTSASIRY